MGRGAAGSVKKLQAKIENRGFWSIGIDSRIDSRVLGSNPIVSNIFKPYFELVSK
jgi:hypothetical protein